MFNKSMALLCATLMSVGASTQTTERWNWSNINKNNLSFPNTFEWGTTALAYEVEGNSTNNTWYANEKTIKSDGNHFAHEASGTACDHWNRYKEDIQLMKAAGLTTYCFSIEWSKIEPENGTFDTTALQHYTDVCAELNCNGIKPVIILKDYRDPIWFMNCGGFEKEANIEFFERYCLTVFNALKGHAHDFITFWNPESYAMLAYQNNSIPPFKKDMLLAITIIKNQFEAHVRVYQALKKADTAKTIKIGITKQVNRIEPWNVFNPISHIACHYARKLTDNSFYTFFTKGVFSFDGILKLKIGAKINYKNALAPQSIDFIGINYHSHIYMSGTQRVKINNPEEVATDVPGFTIYAEGLYRAVEEVSTNLARPLNIPIYITQNGVATVTGAIRTLHAQQHLYAVSQACKKFDVRGYYYYGLTDAYAWGGYKVKFGIYTIDRVQKAGAQHLLDTIKKFSAQS